VTSVQFKVDGVAVGAADTTAPYSYSWDSSSVADGSHMVSATVTDSVGQMATSTSVTLMVSNAGTYPVTLTSGLLFPAVTTAATGSGSFTINYANGDTSGSVMLAGIVVTGAEIGDAYAGASSTALFALTQNAGNANEWDVPASTTLDAGQRADLAAGKLYVLVRSAANPNGELRAQLLRSARGRHERQRDGRRYGGQRRDDGRGACQRERNQRDGRRAGHGRCRRRWHAVGAAGGGCPGSESLS